MREDFRYSMTDKQAAEIDRNVEHLNKELSDAYDRAAQIMLETVDTDLDAAEQAAQHLVNAKTQPLELARALLALTPDQIANDPVNTRAMALAYNHRDRFTSSALDIPQDDIPQE